MATSEDFDPWGFTIPIVSESEREDCENVAAAIELKGGYENL